LGRHKNVHNKNIYDIKSRSLRKKYPQLSGGSIAWIIQDEFKNSLFV
jgi:hypothetical protein